MLFGQLRKHLGGGFHDIARQKVCKILEGHLHQDHVHVLISIPPKYSVPQVVGYIKGKSAIDIAYRYLGQKKNYGVTSFWARGYFVSTVGTDEDVFARISVSKKKKMIESQLGRNFLFFKL
jgi:putative transposase